MIVYSLIIFPASQYLLFSFCELNLGQKVVICLSFVTNFGIIWFWLKTWKMCNLYRKFFEAQELKFPTKRMQCFLIISAFGWLLFQYQTINPLLPSNIWN